MFDTETRTDETQTLTFGSYRAFNDGDCVEEGLFYSDALSRKEKVTLHRYVKTHKPETAYGGVKELRLLPLREFLHELFQDAYKARCLLVAFNHPFDLSRISRNSTSARGRYAGGFSLTVWTFVDKNGNERRNHYRPEIRIKHIDSKRALIGFTAREEPDREDLIPEGSNSGKPEKGYKFKGHFLDLKTLTFALTDRGHSLASACEAFGVEHEKQTVKKHGEISSQYIEYNRRDVLATSELAFKALEEYQKHRISLQATKAFSPASIGKSYLRDMGIDPVLKRKFEFPSKYLGYAQSSFFGGRTSAHIRKVAVPIVYTDFLSMYPTVNSLMGLWRFVIARKIKVIPSRKREIRAFLSNISLGGLFKPSAWKELHGFVRIIPENDLLPSRSKYSVESNDWQVALNYLTGLDGNPKNALWFSLPDVVASVLLTRKVPKIVDAFRIEPVGVLNNLKPIKLRSAVDINPENQDFFRITIEQRKLLAERNEIPKEERKRLGKALKVLANAASYGIYAEMNRQESEQKVKVRCQGIDPEPYSCTVQNPEKPGEYCFPPFAALITGAARLMLALLEESVSEVQGTYAMEDTDSMAIVAMEKGGLIPCPGGPFRTDGGKDAVKALSWKQVDEISKRFERLNPYSRKAIPGSVLKIETDNYDPKTRKQRQLYCLAISAKRYALFIRNTKGFPELLRSRENNEDDRWSEHGLGHLLNPTDPEDEDREWIARVWQNIVYRGLGMPTKPLGFENKPAVSRMSASSPTVMKPFDVFNEGKEYKDQIKPFNFLLTCHVKEFGHPIGADPEQFHLVAPYTMNPRKWLRIEWLDSYSTGKAYRITTVGNHGNRYTARVKTYGEVLDQYEVHPEAKCADANGEPCQKQTIGLLQRRHVRVEQIKCIGKESNSLEEVEVGSKQVANVYTEYIDPRRDDWETKIRPALKKARLKLLVNKTGMSRRALINARAGRSRPHRRNLELLKSVLKGF